MRIDPVAAQGLKLLVVEDDAVIGSVLCRGLVADGYVVEWVRTSASARAALRARRFAGAILDLGLPDGDGLVLCRDVRQAGITVPIMMLTARSDVEDRLNGFGSGADDYLGKPFALAELSARLAVLLARQRIAHRVTVGGLDIDTHGQSAHVAGVPLALSRREFAVLLCLAHHQGQAVSRATLIEEAWPPDSDITENAVDVYVGYVRRALALHGQAPEIATVRGVGFVMRPKHKPL